MKRETYISKCNVILALSQFKKEQTNLLVNEEEKLREKLLQMKKSNLISEEFCNKVPVGSQPARFYGLAKVHEKNTLLRPIVAMPGSTYHALAAELVNYLRKLPEAN